MKAQKILFLDRDGTLIEEVDDEKIDSFAKLKFLPGVISSLRKIVEELDYKLVMVTNQDKLGTPHFPAETFWPVHDFIIETLKRENIHFLEVHIDEHTAQDNHPNRKPGIGMIKHFLNAQYDIAQSYVVGDRETDVTLAKNLGAKSIFIGSKKVPGADLCTQDWREIYRFLKR